MNIERIQSAPVYVVTLTEEEAQALRLADTFKGVSHNNINQQACDVRNFILGELDTQLNAAGCLYKSADEYASDGIQDECPF